MFNHARHKGAKTEAWQIKKTFASQYMESLKRIEMAHLPSVVNGFGMWEASAPMTPQLCDRTKFTIQDKDGELSGMICDLCWYVGERTSSQFQWTGRDVKLIRQSCRWRHFPSKVHSKPERHQPHKIHDIILHYTSYHIITPSLLYWIFSNYVQD